MKGFENHSVPVAAARVRICGRKMRSWSSSHTRSAHKTCGRWCHGLRDGRAVNKLSSASLPETSQRKIIHAQRYFCWCQQSNETKYRVHLLLDFVPDVSREQCTSQSKRTSIPSPYLHRMGHFQVVSSLDHQDPSKSNGYGVAQKMLSIQRQVDHESFSFPFRKNSPHNGFFLLHNLKTNLYRQPDCPENNVLSSPSQSYSKAEWDSNHWAKQKYYQIDIHVPV